MSRQPVFLTRKFPPSTGGMETLAASVWRSISTVRPDAIKISHGGANRDLLWWLPTSLLRLLWLILRGRVDSVLTGDALMYAAATPLLRLFRIRHATMIMGLDVTYQNPAYRAVVHRLLQRAPQVIAISAATADRAIEFGVPAERITVLRLGVSAPEVSPAERAESARRLRARHGFDESDVLVLTLGRLVRRKGVRWFAADVLGALPDNTHYLVAGDGPEAAEISSSAAAAGVANRVHLLGRVDEDQREELMRGADLFIQPNIAVPGDMEGFGLVTVEAAMRGTPVAAADLEGIKDAVVHGRTGILLPPGQGPAWIAELGTLLTDRSALAALGARFQDEARRLYGEQEMGRALADELGLAAAPR